MPQLFYLTLPPAFSWFGGFPGEMVHAVRHGRTRGGGTSAIYKVTQLLPAEGDDFQYRIKNADEPHERVVKESQMDRVA